MRVLWPHNFDPAKPNSQVFMNLAAEGIRARGVDLHCEYLGNLRSIKNFVAARRRLRQLARNFDIVHAQYGSACGFVTAAVEGVPKVLSIRGSDWNVVSKSLGFYYLHTRLARWMTRTSIASYDVLLTASRRVAHDIQRFSPQSNVIPMPSPVDLLRFVPRAKAEARRILGFPKASEERWVLFNAINLRDPVKRFPLAKKAFDLASQNCGNLRLRIASGMPHADLPLFTAACDVLLCTSETEGWPNCVKEALACNVPFVATDVSDLADIASVEPSCRVCPDEPEVIARNLCEVLSIQEEFDIRRHVTRMDVVAIAEQLHGIYEALLTGATRSERSAGNH